MAEGSKYVLGHTISCNMDMIHEFSTGVNSLFMNAQDILNEGKGILNTISGTMGSIPGEALHGELADSIRECLSRMEMCDIGMEGFVLVRKANSYVDNLYSADSSHAEKVRGCAGYFQGLIQQNMNEYFHTEIQPVLSHKVINANNITIACIDKLRKGTERKAVEKKIEQFIAQYLEENILNGVNYKIDTSGLSQRDKNRIYVTDMENYLWRNSGWAIQTYYASGVPTSVRDICKNKMEESMKARAETYEQASDLKDRLMSIDVSDYIWKADFLTSENAIKLIDIFERHDVNDVEHRANFLAQIYEETGGGRNMRESLKLNNEDDFNRFESLSDTYNLIIAEQYVLNHPENYLSTQQSENYLAGNGKERFIDVISRPYNNTNGREVINFNYSSNNLPGKENGDSGKELAAYIGSGVDSPFQISDLVLYRGGGCMQITAKENYYRFAYYIETEFHDIEAANDIRKNGCYSQYITDTYCLESAEWYYFEGPNRVNEEDSSEEITGKVYGKQNSSRNSTQEVIQNALENE